MIGLPLMNFHFPANRNEHLSSFKLTYLVPVLQFLAPSPGNGNFVGCFSVSLPRNVLTVAIITSLNFS